MKPEAEFQKKVMLLARMLGWRVAHFHDSRRMVRGRLVGDKDAAGYPDLTLCHPKHGVVWIELKSDKGRPTPAQRAWIRDLHSAGQVAYVFRPRDWRRVEQLLRTGQAIPVEAA